MPKCARPGCGGSVLIEDRQPKCMLCSRSGDEVGFILPVSPLTLVTGVSTASIAGSGEAPLTSSPVAVASGVVQVEVVRGQRCRSCGGLQTIKYGGSGETAYRWCKECETKYTVNEALFRKKWPLLLMVEAFSLKIRGHSFSRIKYLMDDTFGKSPSSATLSGWFNDDGLWSEVREVIVCKNFRDLLAAQREIERLKALLEQREAENKRLKK